METSQSILEKIQAYGVGRRTLDDVLFLNDKPPPRLGVYDFDEENYCHEMIKSSCSVPGCTFIAESLLEFENHYNASHRYACGQCKKNLPSPHLLDLHIQETHDSFFAVMAERKPSYCCYIEECKEKFKNGDDRLQHCIKEHKLPKDFRFESKPSSKKSKKSRVNQNKGQTEVCMDLDGESSSSSKHKVILTNSKQKTFAKYTGRQFTKSKNISKEVNMDEIMVDLKDNLPE
ncbi:unnamed protein product [Arctia plantaginis]|uniref:C2H2-type domain-containing protein n=1 Tax=Arctia plantaginis TaxID=874455 RepID=A0A8S0YMV0_ARCPL|nr:unnamed protein product [Arctia plantaginis]